MLLYLAEWNRESIFSEFQLNYTFQINLYATIIQNNK